MGNYCCICKRRLKNPLSIKLGIGPVCRAKHDLQEEFDFMYAQFEVLSHVSGEYIYIRDIGQCVRSVTNDAKNVIEQLFQEYRITEKTRVFYDDSDGRTDEMLHSHMAFTGFKAGHEGVDLRGTNE